MAKPTAKIEKAKIEKAKDVLLHSDNFLFTFLRSGVSSQVSALVDFGVGFVLFAFVHLTVWLSTAIGATVGGILNCIINYRFTFHARGVDWRAVGVKFFLVWLGSMLLNSFGTQALFWMIRDWDWLETLGFKHDGYYAAARLTVSLIVCFGWNFLMQRYFVFRRNGFDRYAIAFCSAFGIEGKGEN